MDCFNHPRYAAVGVCKACGKALCAECLVEVEGGIACKDTCEERVATLSRRVTALPYKGIRKRSQRTWFGLPLYDIAIGPDLEKGQMRGHAKGIIAIGDTARGGLAIGGVAAGVIATGGVAVGLLTFAGCALGVLALGGLAIGGIAIGGGAIGIVAVGGGAVGYYACGGGAMGKYVLSASQQDPEALQFFQRWMPWLSELLHFVRKP